MSKLQLLPNLFWVDTEKSTDSETYLGVDTETFFSALRQRDPVEVLRMLGLDWKRNPSVKVAKGSELVWWN